MHETNVAQARANKLMLCFGFIPLAPIAGLILAMGFGGLINIPRLVLQYLIS